MPIACQPYYTVRERLRTFLKVSKPQLTNLSLLTFGLFAASNSQLPRIAANLPLLTGAASLTQRLRRLLINRAIEPCTLYQPVACFVLTAFCGGEARLILDATDLGGRLPVLAGGCRSCSSPLPIGAAPSRWPGGCCPRWDAVSSPSKRHYSARSPLWCRFP